MSRLVKVLLSVLVVVGLGTVAVFGDPAFGQAALGYVAFMLVRIVCGEGK